MILNIITHTGRRVSYQTLVKITFTGPTESEARVVDETGLWEAIVQVDARLANRLDNDAPNYFWARIRGGEIDLKERELDPDLCNW